MFSRTTQPIEVGPSNPHGRVHWLCGNRGGEPAQWPPAENTSASKLRRQTFQTVRGSPAHHATDWSLCCGPLGRGQPDDAVDALPALAEKVQSLSSLGASGSSPSWAEALLGRML